MQGADLWLVYGNSVKSVDSCPRRFTGTFNRAKVFEAAITRVLQQSDSAARVADYGFNTPVIGTAMSGSLNDSSDTEVHTEVSVQLDDSRSCNVSDDGRVTLLLNCAALSHSSIHDMTATCLRQVLVSQHIHALLSAARSVLQVLHIAI